MASRRKPALPLIAACTLLSLAACGETVTIIATLMDSDASIDIALDEETEVAVDPVDEEPEPAYEFNTCLGVCALQLICFGDLALLDHLCGAMCARLTNESRTCLNDALEAGSCYAIEDCIGGRDFECEMICDFVWWRCGSEPICPVYCPMYSDLPRECAMTAAGERDCGSTVECLVGHSFGATCHDACTMLIETCGVDADFDSCMGNCGSLDIDSMSRSCIDAARYYSDCEALAACGELVP